MGGEQFLINEEAKQEVSEIDKTGIRRVL